MSIVRIIESFVDLTCLEEEYRFCKDNRLNSINVDIEVLYKEYERLLGSLDVSQLEEVKDFLVKKIQILTDNNSIDFNNINLEDKALRNLALSLDYYGYYLANVEERLSSVKTI